MSAERRMRVMTWNIHAGRNLWGRRDLDRIAAFVRRQDPDVVALQEVDSRRRRGVAAAFEILAATLGEHMADARLVTAPDGEYGHVVISRWPYQAIRRHDISVAGREPRAAIETNVETPFGPLHLVAAHFGLSLRERRRQAAFVAALARAGPSRSVLLGDFNDWVWRGSVQQVLADCMPGRTRHRTFPSLLPVLSLDKIYCRPANLIARSWTDRSASGASDHLPVIADLDLGAAGA